METLGKKRSILQAVVVFGILGILVLPGTGVFGQLENQKASSTSKSLTGNVMWVDNTSAIAGTVGHVIYVNGTWDFTIGGYDFAMYYDASKIHITKINLVGTIGDYPDSQWQVFPQYGTGKVAAAAFLYDTDIPPNEEYPGPGSARLFKMFMTINEHATNGDTILNLDQKIRIGLVDCYCTYSPPNGPVVYPSLIDGVLTISGGNDVPYEPGNPSPGDDATGVLVDTTLSWSGGDPNGDDVTYDVYCGTSSTPPKVISNQSDTTYTPTLDHSRKYYWKIVAWDEHGASHAGPVWEFTTVVLNHPPYAPSAPSPTDGATGVLLNVVLSWTGGDPDLGDTVKYDVYFSTSSPPVKVVSNQTDTSYDPPGLLSYDTMYYWKIIAWDTYDASNASPIWDFTTKLPPPPPKPDLDCQGSLSWDEVDPGSTVEGTFIVKNVGGSGSKLNWSIVDKPDWGTWTFTPESGTNVTSATPKTVQVSVVAPDDKDTNFTGQIKVVNTDNVSDYDIVEVWLKTPRTKGVIVHFLEQLLERFPMLQRLFSFFPLLSRMVNLP